MLAKSWEVRLPIGMQARSASSLSLSLSLSLSYPRTIFVARNNFFKKVYCILIFNSLYKNGEQGGVINGAKELSHITFKYATWLGIISRNFANHFFSNKNSLMGSFTNSARKGSRNECWLKGAIKDAKDCMMQNSVSNSRL